MVSLDTSERQLVHERLDRIAHVARVHVDENRATDELIRSRLDALTEKEAHDRLVILSRAIPTQISRQQQQQRGQNDKVNWSRCLSL